MPSPFDDDALLAAMRDYVRASDRLASAEDARALMDLADEKSMAGMRLRKRLQELGWTAPTGRRSAGQRSTT